jgi:hyperosmotically inducible protein
MRFLIQIICALCIGGLVGCQQLPNVSTTASPERSLQNDDSISATVKSAIYNNEEYQTATIGVTTEQGIVTLTGFVKTIRQYDGIVRLVSEVPGVKGVYNHLVIRK